MLIMYYFHSKEIIRCVNWKKLPYCLWLNCASYACLGHLEVGRKVQTNTLEKTVSEKEHELVLLPFINRSILYILVSSYSLIRIFIYQNSKNIYIFKNPALCLLNSICSKNDSSHFYDALKAYLFSLNSNPNKFLTKIVRSDVFLLSNLFFWAT